MLDRLTVQCFYNRDLLNILQALVSSGNYSHEDFSSNFVQPSELSSVPVPRSFEGKTYIQLFQYLISKRAVLPLGLYRHCPMDDVSPQPYVITNPSPELLLTAQDSIFALLSPESMAQVALGDIVVAVVEAELPPRSLERNRLGPHVPSSVSCIIESEGETAQTDTCINVQWPHWNFTSRFSINEQRGIIEITVVDGEKYTAETFLGKATVPLEPLVADGREQRSSDSWVQLSGRHCDGLQAKGQVRLQLCFVPNMNRSQSGVKVTSSIQVDEAGGTGIK